MIGLYVTVPIACFRRGLAREYLETERLPPPSTCYGFLLSLVGETRRARHVGCRVAPGLVGQPSQSVVLRTVWRCKDSNTWTGPNGQTHLVSSKDKKTFVKWALEQGWPEPHFGIGLGRGTNARPDYQQLLTGVEALIWCDSVDELRENGATLEERVATAMQTPHRVCRFGGLSLGRKHASCRRGMPHRRPHPRATATGKGTLVPAASNRPHDAPGLVDHVGSAGTRYVTGDLVECDLAPPPIERMPQVRPPD